MAKQNQVEELTKLNTENYENCFNVYQEEDGLYYYNILQTVVFPSNLPQSFFAAYNVSHGDTWPLISFKNYNTPNLWWIILIANKIQNATIIPKPGTTLAVPKIEVVKEILAEINKT